MRLVIAVDSINEDKGVMADENGIEWIMSEESLRDGLSFPVYISGRAKGLYSSGEITLAGRDLDQYLSTLNA